MDSYQILNEVCNFLHSMTRLQYIIELGQYGSVPILLYHSNTLSQFDLYCDYHLR